MLERGGVRERWCWREAVLERGVVGGESAIILFLPKREIVAVGIAEVEYCTMESLLAG